MGAGLLQSFIDSGYLIIGKDEIRFEGVLAKETIKVPAN
jgi:hypothetical protein